MALVAVGIGPTGPVRPAGAADPETVAEARAAVDEVAEAYLDAEIRSRELDAELAGLEDRLADAEARAAAAQAEATARAVEIYMGQGSGNQLSSLLSAADALESARRIELVDRANAQSTDAFREAADRTEELERRRADLAEARAEHADLVEELAGRQRELEARLATVRAAWQAEQERRAEAERRAAERRAAAERAAEAERAADAGGDTGSGGGAPTTTSPPTTAAPTTPAPEPPAASPPAPSDPPAAPDGVHPRHHHPFLVCTRGIESNGDYRAYNPAGPGYWGAYQFAQSTWNATAAHAGRPALIGVNPAQASVWDQDDLAWALFQWQGKRPWLGRC